MITFQGNLEQADPLYLRAIEIAEKTLGPDHPELATCLNNRAMLLESQVIPATWLQEFLVVPDNLIL